LEHVNQIIRPSHHKQVIPHLLHHTNRTHRYLHLCYLLLNAEKCVSAASQVHSLIVVDYSRAVWELVTAVSDIQLIVPLDYVVLVK
jgi:hypothetical protein